MTAGVVDFGDAVLPYGVFRPAGGVPRIGVAVRDLVLDLAEVFDDPSWVVDSLNPFLARGRRWRETAPS